MLFLIQSGLLNFTAALVIALLGILTWNLGHDRFVATMNIFLCLLNIGLGIMNIAIHPAIWQ